MIESIAVQTESLIESQESDEFISATETTKGEEDDDDRRRLRSLFINPSYSIYNIEEGIRLDIPYVIV